MSIEAAKIKIIQLVTELQNEAILKQLLTFLTGFNQPILNETAKQQEILRIATTPTPPTVSLEQLKIEQPYNLEKMNQMYAHIDRSIWEGEDIQQLFKD